MDQMVSQDRFGIPFVLDGEFSYYPYNPERLRPIKSSRRIGQAILSARKARLGSLHCDRDYRHFQVQSELCGKECFLPEFVKQLLLKSIVPVAIAEAGTDPYVVDYNTILGVTDSGNFLNPRLLHSDIYDKIAIGETPCLDGVELSDTTLGMTEALMECSVETRVVMLNYLVTNLSDNDSFEIFRGLVLRSSLASLQCLLDLSNRRLGQDHKLVRLLEVSINGMHRNAMA